MKVVKCVLLPLLVLIVSAYISVSIPKLSIPFTAQSLAVFVIAGLLSPRYFAIVILSYLGLGLVGVPVFAEGTAGLSKVLGNSGGFLYGFLFSGAVIVYSTHKESEIPLTRLINVMLLATVVLFVFGVGHLAIKLDLQKALLYGLYPYWKMAVIKALLAAVIVWIIGPIASKWVTSQQI